MTRLLFTYFFIFISIDKSFCQKDTSPPKVLTINDFWRQVKDNHPMAKQAILFNRIGSAELLSAKGGFDPKLYGDWAQKHFDRKNYFSIGEYGVKIPTWYGIELKGAYNTAHGVFLNPEEKLPQNGQAVVGISLPLIQGLMIDERRADVFKARQSIGLNEAERAALLNDLALETTKIYWKWAFYYRQMEVFRQALAVAETRFNAIYTTYEQGDRMAMDTLESFIQVQDRQFQYNEALLDYQNITTELTAFITAGKNIQNAIASRPQNFEAADTPLSYTDEQREVLSQNLLAAHPTLRLYDFKLAQLDVDRRLKQEKLKPKLNLNYNFLGNGFQLSNIFTDNYKWGLTFSASSLFRNERGNVQLVKIKIENTQLLLEQKRLDLNFKLQQYFNENENLQNQFRVYSDIVNNYQQLLQMESTRFELGESSLFLINSREMKVIESQVKLAKIRSDIEIARASIDWASGTLADKL
jgi:outer membrane protein TolC